MLLLACSGNVDVVEPTASVFTPIAQTTAINNELPPRLKRFTYLNRNLFLTEFTYDSRGRQASTWAYIQRSGEGKENTSPAFIRYDEQGRVAAIEEGSYLVDAATGSLTLTKAYSQQEFTYSLNRLTIRQTLGGSSFPVKQVFDIDGNGYYVHQVIEAASGYRSDYTFRYADGNVVQADYTSIDPSGVVLNRTRTLYEYDTNPNPLLGLLGVNSIVLMDVPTSTSKNNAIKYTVQRLTPDGSTTVSSTVVDYKYQYNDRGYPVSYMAGTLQGGFTYF